MSARNAEPKWLSHRQACDYLQINEQTLYRLARNGDVPFHKIGGKRLYRVEELDEAIMRWAKEKK